MADKQNIETRKKILLAAEDVFQERGKDGATMQMIAERAGVNKAMLFYYFTNKDLLYKEVLRANFSQMFFNLGNIIFSEIESEEKIDHFVNTYIDFIVEHPDLPRLMLREIAAGGENVKEIMNEFRTDKPLKIPDSFISFLNSNVKSGKFREIDPRQIIISLIGMCLFYFLGKPVLQVIFQLEDTDEEQFLIERKQSIIDLLKYGIISRSEDEDQ